MIGSDGPVVDGHAGEVTQDFVFLNAKAFGVTDVKLFLGMVKTIEKNLDDPEVLKKLASHLARGTNAVLGLAGAHSATLEQVGAPQTHPVGETYGSTVALRYGDHVAKLAFTSLSENLRALTGRGIKATFHYAALRDAIVEFLRTETAA